MVRLKAELIARAVITMQGYEKLVNSHEFAQLTTELAQYPKKLISWEKLLVLINTHIGNVNKAIDAKLYKLLKTTYTDMLYYFPLLENYYIDYALLEYKLGHFKSVHTIFKEALAVHNNRSLLLWKNYLQICNKIVIDQRQLLKKYSEAEDYIGVHYLSGEFWEMYLEVLKERCNVKIRYYSTLRKVLEIPLHSFSKFYAIWLKHIDDDITDLSKLKLFVSEQDIREKLLVDINYKGRRGPYIQKAKEQLKKYTQDLYTIVQYQVIERYSLFESKLTVQYYTSCDDLVSADQQIIWDKYLDYVINLNIAPLTQTTFQRALVCLAHYDFVWIKYAQYFLKVEEDIYSAKNVLLKSLQYALRKGRIIELLTVVLVKTNELYFLDKVFKVWEDSLPEGCEDIEDFQSFWNYIEFQVYLHRNKNQSRYEDSNSNAFLSDHILSKIMHRLEYQEKRQGHGIILSHLVDLQTKSNTQIIEDKVFKEIIRKDLTFLIGGGLFWYLYSKLIFFDSERSYLERRGYIIERVWSQIPKQYYERVSTKLLEFCETYLPEDVDIVYDMRKEQ